MHTLNAPNIHFKAGDSEIDIQAQGALNFNARHIAINAPTIIIRR